METQEANRDLINTIKLMNLSGATYRQIAYWSERGIIRAAKNHDESSGYPKFWHPSLVEKLRVMVEMSNLLKKQPTLLVQLIHDNFEDGEVSLDEALTLKWR